MTAPATKVSCPLSSLARPPSLCPALTPPLTLLLLLPSAGKIQLGSDPAASEFYDKASAKYDLDFKSADNDGSQKKSAAEMVQLYEKLCQNFPMVLLEGKFPLSSTPPLFSLFTDASFFSFFPDPFDEDDFASHAELTSHIGKEVEIVGDDLYW